MTAASYSPLDSLKEVYLIVIPLIETAQEQICRRLDDDDDLQRLLDAASSEVAAAVDRHVPGVSHPKAWPASHAHGGRLDVNTYDDGTLISVPLVGCEIHPSTREYFPRRDGPREVHEASLRLEVERAHTERPAPRTIQTAPEA